MIVKDSCWRIGTGWHSLYLLVPRWIFNSSLISLDGKPFSPPMSFTITAVCTKKISFCISNILKVSLEREWRGRATPLFWGGVCWDLVYCNILISLCVPKATQNLFILTNFLSEAEVSTFYCAYWPVDCLWCLLMVLIFFFPCMFSGILRASLKVCLSIGYLPISDNIGYILNMCLYSCCPLFVRTVLNCLIKIPTPGAGLWQRRLLWYNVINPWMSQLNSDISHDLYY